MDEEAYKSGGGAVAESGGDTDIDRLLHARSEIDSALRRHKAQFAVVFTDIVGSTAFFERFGDTAGLVMLQRHHELVLPAIEEGGGNVVKTIGDAVLATFPSAEAAAKTAVEIQRRLDAHNEDRRQEERIYTRVGINFGTGFVKDRDLYGDVVNTAARFVKACAPAQILVTRTVSKALAQHKEIPCRKVGVASLHGKAAPEDMYEIIWTSADRYDRLRHELDKGAPGPATRSALGRYELLEELGKGAMGVVYKAYDPAVGRIVALKTVRLDVTGPERDELIRRLRQEAQAAGRLEHPNIVTIHDAGEAEGLFYLTMQFIKGRTLAELIGERAMLPVEQIVLLSEQICEGLHYAHERGIVHRDLKPTNIIVAPEGTAKIVDFGIAKVAEVGTTKAGIVIGTPSYMSPEQAQGGRVDRRSDIFSLGAMLYELLTGEKAFPGNTPTAIIYKILHEDPIPVRVIEPTVNPAIDRIVRKALAKNPFERYQTCQEFQEDLRAVARLPADQTRKAVSPKEARPRTGKPQRKPVSAPAPAVQPEASRRRIWDLALATVLWGGVAFVVWQQNALSLLRHALVPSAQTTPISTGGHPAAPPASAPKEPSVSVTPAPAREAPPGASKGETREPPAGAKRIEPKPRRTEPASATKEAGPSPRTRAQAAAPPPSKASAALSEESQRQVERWFHQAEQYIGQGQYKEAIVVLEQILSKDPKNQRAQETLVKVQRMQEPH